MRILLVVFLSLLLFCVFGQEDVINRNLNMPLAAAAYSNSPNECLSNVGKYWSTSGNRTFTLYRKYSLKCASLNDTCSGYLAIDNDADDQFNVPAFYVVFKGTTNFEQFFGSSFWKYDEMVAFGRNDGNVSKQIFDAFNEIWVNAGMKNDLLTLKNKYLDSYFTFLGHSTGGAMASMAAATVILTEILPTNNVGIVTFGEPRSGDKDYANAFNNLVNTLFANRIIHNADIVPHLPSLNDTKYYHHAEEYWYPNNMGINDTFIACGPYDGEVQNCSRSLDGTKLTFDDHKNYFGRDFIAYGINGCSDLL